MDISNNENNTSNYYTYDDFFKNYLKQNNIEGQEFADYDNEKKKTLMLKIQKLYRTTHPEDYKIELKIRTELYEKQQKEKEESMKKAKQEYMEIKKEETIQMVMRQTDYDYNTAKELLEQNNYNYLEIIKNYINGNKDQKQEIKQQNTKSVNQQIYSQIRSFMDYGSRIYEQKKRTQELQNKSS